MTNYTEVTDPHKIVVGPKYYVRVHEELEDALKSFELRWGTPVKVIKYGCQWWMQVRDD